MSDFDLAGPLPTETTLPEASAGTGKTYAIAALTTRYLAEAAFDVSDLLLITFGNHAAGELRSRVFGPPPRDAARPRSRRRRRALPEPDPIVDLLSGVDGARARLADAIARFTEATIDTTHGFCQTMLRGSASSATGTPQRPSGRTRSAWPASAPQTRTFVCSRAQADPPLSPRQGLHIGIAAATTTLPLLPTTAPSRVRRLSARRVRAQEAHGRALHVRRHHHAPAPRARRQVHPRPGPLPAARAFPRCPRGRVQDTDPDQWEIIENAFVAPAVPRS
ncbi:MAG: UvrD-helicase domain-containing protein [Tessaracoccus sp.]|nr:UvrD-helicase domain-containing protein [Tessaracoccus sp.]